jgi:DNA helicase INO80
MRAKKITREMMNFWKRRDKEIADLKRRKEKVEKEFRRKQEEEKEALLQKKRLEFIMQ